MAKWQNEIRQNMESKKVNSVSLWNYKIKHETYIDRKYKIKITSKSKTEQQAKQNRTSKQIAS